MVTCWWLTVRVDLLVVDCEGFFRFRFFPAPNVLFFVCILFMYLVFILSGLVFVTFFKAQDG